ncbi:MAG TPA: zinc-binding dehydrogenase [Acidimicrobiia bacterium]|jgi:threonine dehydrogenase-like Zn-dependent dehydrogenase
MRAVVARNKQLVVDEVDDPVPGPGEALVAVRACGICGSDLHALKFADEMVAQGREAGLPQFFDPALDYVMGHEFCCEVLDLGPGCDGAPVQAGDLVTSLPVMLNANGIEPVGAYSNLYNGGYAERMRLTAGLCLKVPNGLDARRAACTEPMAVGRHAVGKADIAPRDTALVLGCGPVGLAVIAELRRRNVDTIVAADYWPSRRAVATAMGASDVVDPAAEPAIEAWRRVTGGMQPLVQFEAIGVPGVLDRAMKDAPPQSRIVVVGVCMQPDHVHPFVGISKELRVQFVLAYDPFEFGDTLRAIAEGEIDVAPLLTGACGLDGVAGAFTALGDPEQHVKVMVEPQRSGAVAPL